MPLAHVAAVSTIHLPNHTARRRFDVASGATPGFVRRIGLWLLLAPLLLAGLCSLITPAAAQPLGRPDRGEPGDAMIQAYLAEESAKLAAEFAADLQSLETWQAKRPEYVEQYLYMLGLSPLPPRTPLEATITGQLEGDGYVVEMLHYLETTKPVPSPIG